jgi:hypothetical protein
MTIFRSSLTVGNGVGRCSGITIRSFSCTIECKLQTVECLTLVGTEGLYRLRSLVERCFNKLKNTRRVATCYDKTAESFLGFIDITSIRVWLRHLST